MNIQEETSALLMTDRLILRHFTAEDEHALFLILKDRECNTYLPWFLMETLEETRAFLQKRFLDRYQRSTPYQYAICLKENNIPIGFTAMSEDEGHELGYALRTDYWHKGIVTEACAAVAQCLKRAGFPYITATYDVSNVRSGEIMKKIGMTYRYSYKEWTKPKNQLVTFRMYQLDFAKQDGVEYRGHLKNSADGTFFVEAAL